MIIKANITKEDIKKSEQVLIDNGIDKDEAETVLQALGYTLLNIELYPDQEGDKNAKLDLQRN